MMLPADMTTSTNAAPAAYTCHRSPDQDRREAAHHPVVIAGAGPVGLVLALDLAKKGQRCVVLDKRTSLSDGSRAICWAKRTLEIMGRLGLADNLGWKLDLVLRGLAPEALIDSYADERQLAADENILNSTRATDFIAPKGAGATLFRDAVLELAGTHPFARRLLNSGRLSLPTTYDGSALNSADAFTSGTAPNLRPGAPAADAPEGNAWLLPLLGDRFTVLAVGPTNAKLATAFNSAPATSNGIPVKWRTAHSPEAMQRYGATEGIAVYLIRPDNHIAARGQTLDLTQIAQAVDRATARVRA